MTSLPSFVVTAAAALFGSLIGSFLNVCIYRLPRGLSVHSPSRSYCPHCRRTIPWWENIPIFSWIILRGRCSACKAAIAARYLLVEVLTAVLFGSGAAFLPLSDPLLLLPLFTLLGILVVATFVDMEHLIIPNEVTWGGVIAGALYSLFLPAMHHASSPQMGLGLSLCGAATGYGLLFAVAKLGRLAFGKKRTLFASSTQLQWIRSGDQAELSIGTERTSWGDYFIRGSEEIRMGGSAIHIDGAAFQDTEILWHLNDMHIGLPGESRKTVIDLNLVREISLQVQWMILPREVMGYGDVKFLAAIGAFLGSEATVFTLAAASCLGACYFVLSLLMGRRQWPPLPFGPYLAAGSLVWIVAGPNVVQAYLRLIAGGH